MNEIERTIRDLQLYVDVKWGGTNDMLNLALTALKDFCKLQQENERLQAQVARMREALIECVNALELCTHDELCKIAVSPYDMIQDAKEALAAIDKAIGEKEDV